MKVALIAAAALLAFGAHAGPVEDAMTKAGCMACHAKDKKILGPSFKDIAVKYKLMYSRKAFGVKPSEIVVKPRTSTNSTVNSRLSPSML